MLILALSRKRVSHAQTVSLREIITQRIVVTISPNCLVASDPQQTGVMPDIIAVAPPAKSIDDRSERTIEKVTTTRMRL